MVQSPRSKPRNTVPDASSQTRLLCKEEIGPWYRENTASCTCVTPVVCGELYEMFNAEPEHWEILTWYPQEALKPDTLEQFFRVWRNKVPEKHKAFITAMANRFEYDLDKPASP